MAEKQIELKKMGAGVLLKDQMTVSQWYMFKTLMATAFGMIVFFIVSGIMDSPVGKPLTVIAAVAGWFFLDLLLRLQNKSSNDEMMPDIMEMSRSVLYGKRGGQYIADALDISYEDALAILIRPGTPYKHYKTNKVYHVKAIAKDGNTEVNTLYVIYEDSLNPSSFLFVRPLEEFLEKITDTQRRFTKV